MMTTPVFHHTLEEAFLYCRDMDASLRERLDMFSAEARRLRLAMQDAVDRLVWLTATMSARRHHRSAIPCRLSLSRTRGESS
jgi:hypothetical protein